MNASSELEKETTEIEQNNAQDEQTVINYLNTHPDFFNHNPSLLANIKIAHNSGSAISLIERQVDILRQQNKQQKIQLAELFEIANENEQSNQKIHKLILALLDSKNLSTSEKALTKVLCNDFSVDAISLRVFVEPKTKQAQQFFIAKDSPVANQLDKLLYTRKPQCGYFKNLHLEELFAEQAESLASFAVLPLFVEKNNCFGVLIMGSHNIRRFSADMGTLFLERMSESISHILISFVKK
ncbi:MAG: DUF484 family protein [gamma proteobacterium symbiont of Taylorina sp.]|nr:DUF484 family protein [gamma proteobacterium symbiont of Taylorina sp.]